MQDIYDVKLTKQALRDLKKVPLYIALKLQAWVDDVGHRGLGEVRKIPGYHDEPLSGDRLGQRSIRLNRSYRAMYTIEEDGTINFVEVREVNKHEY
jgi:proteic killer suppression protein